MNNNLSFIENQILLSRARLFSSMLDPQRNIEYECGHPDTVSIAEYHRMFERGDVAARVVTLYPEETWSQMPLVYETEDEAKTPFEDAWDTLEKDMNLLPQLYRADVLSGVGRYGVILLGFDDGGELTEPVPGVPLDGSNEKEGSGECELLYLRPLEELYVQVTQLEADTKSPRFGKPVRYLVQFIDNVIGGQSTIISTDVHWTRMIHVADNRTNSDVFGMPRMERVLNRLLDLRKIAGGAAEMFWKGGFPGLSLESHPQLGETVELDVEKTKQQMDAYMSGLQRYIATIGMQAKTLSPNVADPTPHAMLQLKLIATAMSVPWRLLAGSEQAQLASEQDSTNWNRRMTRRREDYVTPFLIKPFIDRLILAGALPPVGDDGYKVDWPDLFAPSMDQRALIALNRTKALQAYVTSGLDVLIPPYFFLTLVMDYDPEEADAIIAAAGDNLQQELDAAAAAAAAQPALPPPGPNGKPAAKPSQPTAPPPRTLPPVQPSGVRPASILNPHN